MRRDRRSLPPLGWPNRREWLWASLVMAAATTVMLLTQVRAFTSVSDLGDPLFSMWRLAWVAHTLPSHPAHLFDANIFYPETRTLAYSDAMLLPALLGAPALWLGVPVAVVYTSLLLLSFVTAGVAMFAFARGVTGATGAALVAGLIFAFDPFRLAHYAHLELLFTCFMPIAAFCLVRTLARGDWRDGALTGVFTACQGLCSLYYGAYLAIALVAVLLSWAVFIGRPARGALAALAGGALIASSVALLATQPYWVNRSTMGDRQRDEVLAFSATVGDYLAANETNPRYAGARPPVNGERELVPGVVPVMLAVAAFVPPVGPMATIAAAVLATTVDGSFGLNGVIYSRLYAWLPPFRGFRAPARFRAVAGAFLALLAGLGVAGLTRRLSAGWPRSLALATMAVAVLIDLHPTLDLTLLPQNTPAIYAWLAEQPRGVVCEFPVGNLRGRAGPQDATYEYYSTLHWMPLVNGYSGFAPESYRDLQTALSGFPDERSLHYLGDHGVTYLLVHSVFYVEGDYRHDITALGASPSVQWIGSFSWRDGGQSAAFRVIAPSQH